MTDTALAPADLKRFLDEPGIHVLGVMSLALLVINSSHDGVLLPTAIGLLVLGVLVPWLLMQPAWWLTIFVVFGTRHLLAWEGVDNHVMLTTYWCLAFGLSLLAVNPLRTLGRSGRLLIGFAFAFATGWKLFVPAFRSGDFFQFTLLVDERFEQLGTVIAGVSEAGQRQNQAALDAIATADFAPVTVGLADGPHLVTLAAVLTVATIVIEALVTLAFLAPLPERWTWLRPATLLAFCTTTYLLVPVTGFGAVLVVMALADPGMSPTWRRLLLGLLAALVLYTPAWRLAFG